MGAAYVGGLSFLPDMSVFETKTAVIISSRKSISQTKTVVVTASV